MDDVTFLTSPFYQDGVIAKAVDSIAAMGVTYFTSAGNFGNKSYEGAFSPMVAPWASQVRRTTSAATTTCSASACLRQLHHCDAMAGFHLLAWPDIHRYGQRFRHLPDQSVRHPILPDSTATTWVVIA